MAQIFGEPGGNAAEESYTQTRRFLMITLIGIAVLSAIWGFALGAAFPIKHLGWPIALVIAGLFWVVIFLIYRRKWMRLIANACHGVREHLANGWLQRH